MTTATTVLSNSARFRLAVLVLVVAATATAATAQTYTDLFNFSSNGGPNDPFSSVITQGRDGSMYTTSWTRFHRGTRRCVQDHPGGNANGAT